MLSEIETAAPYRITLLTEFMKNTMFDEKIGGTFHAAVGAGFPETGCVNESGLHWDMVCDMRSAPFGPGGEIFADGEVFLKDGKFLREGWPGN